MIEVNVIAVVVDNCYCEMHHLEDLLIWLRMVSVVMLIILLVLCLVVVIAASALPSTSVDIILFSVKLVSDVSLITIPDKHLDDWKIFIPLHLSMVPFVDITRHLDTVDPKILQHNHQQILQSKFSSLCKDYRCNNNCKQFNQL